MKRFFILCLAITGLLLETTAHPVDQETAMTIAGKFMKNQNLTMAATYHTEMGIPAFYIFNTHDGFVIVSADDCETPIIAYSHESQFDPSDVPVQMEDYLQDFVTRIQYGIENHIVADETTARQWELVKTIGRLNDSKSTKAVAPLITAKWHQGCLYNSLCPIIENQPCGHAEVGCVAVAMAQIMHYWKFPEYGIGSHAYMNSGITLSADFGNTFYDWSLMSDALDNTSSDAEIEAIATILFHCGISVNMRYNTSGSGASSTDVPYALTHYFKFSQDLHLEKPNDDMTGWLKKLKDCLDQEQPIYYSGHGSGGHAFVCDGYDDNDLLHFNWGWGGNGDGYFALGNLNPLGHTYSHGNTAILDIVPNRDPCYVVATAYPPKTGTITGTGEYQFSESCTLTAIPAENCEFLYWKKDGAIVSYDTAYTLIALHSLEMEANFSFKPAKQITVSHTHDTNDPNCPYISLSWENHDDNLWSLLKQFETNDENGVATDGEYLYTCHSVSYSDFMFGKYTLDGELVELFNVNGCGYANNLTYDGKYFYCIGTDYQGYKKIYCVDLTNKILISTINVNTTILSYTYDAINDGFWIGRLTTKKGQSKFTLIDRDGHIIKDGPTTPHTIVGTGYHIAKDGNPHLLLVESNGNIYDYNITNNVIHEHPLTTLDGNPRGASIGKYNGKEALFVIIDNTAYIYEINSNLSQIACYRMYRSDNNNNNNVIMLSEKVFSATYIDSTWKDVSDGIYLFGVSSVFANGKESETVWSDTVARGSLGKEAMMVYPNPVGDRLVIESPLFIHQCEVFTLEGDLVFSQSAEEKRIEIQTDSWSSGIYIIRISTDAWVETKRFIKK